MQADFSQALSSTLAPKFAISYIRVSTAGQAERGGGDDEGFSIPAQREANKRKAHSLGAMIGKEFVDRGASARSADRPELQNMLAYIKENSERVDYVIVHKVDRWARNRGDDIDITRALTEANVQLVSASENIDNTPSGMLMHGIMSSIAEFYSQNLSTEVKKGMSEKVKSGGTPSKAPLGYRNIRGYDERGRRDSRVEVDEQRAPLVKKAFELYATGNWSVGNLAEHLADMGLDTATTPRLPSKPLTKKMLYNVFNNPYYKGVVTYNGVQYAGKHTAIIDEATWDKVQEILKSHINGERLRIHEHYLKSTVYCGNCGARLIITKALSRSGDRYPYFICSARHAKRNDCCQRALLIEDIERRIEELYEQISFTPEFRKMVGDWLHGQIEKLAGEAKAEVERLKRQKDKLERERYKLLQAHYADAVPLGLLKEEQDRIGKSLAVITSQMAAYESEATVVAARLDDALLLLDDCGKIYKLAGDYERRCFNQAIFTRILVHEDGSVDAEYAEPYVTILNPNVFALKSVFEKNTKEKNNEQPAEAAHCSFWGSLAQTCEKTANFFRAGLSKDVLVRLTRLELAHLAALPPQGSVYTNFTTGAWKHYNTTRVILL